MTELIKLLSYGKTLATRKQGLDIRLQLVGILQTRNHEHLILDFGGVDLVTHGFIDELLGKLINDFNPTTLKKKLRFKNSDKHKQIINYVIEDRWKNID